MERISKVQQHLEPVAVKTVLGRVSTASEPGLLDAHRRLLECSSIHECEAWLKYFTSVRPESEEGEFDIDLGNVVGTLPTFLLESGGTFVRSGPGLFERDGTRIHMADADGLMATLTFTPRGIKYKKRYIRTPQFALENDLDRILFRGSYGTSQVHGDGLTQRIANNVGNLKWKITGNTNHMFWNRRLFALHEVGLPIELDPITLAVVNPQSTLDSALSSKRQGDSFSAHYRIDPNTNTLLNFGINFVKGDVTFWEFDSEFRLLAQLQVKIFPTVVHSFAITPKYFVHYFPPTKAGLSHVRGVLTYVLGWGVDDSFLHDTSQEFAYICIVERGHLCQTRKQAKPFVTWHRVANFWPNHHVAAFETESGDVCLDSVMFDTKTAGWVEREPFDLPKSRLVRFYIPQSQAKISTNSREYATTKLEAKYELLYNGCCEMPVVSAAVETKQPRFVYLVDMRASKLPSQASRALGLSTRFGPVQAEMPWTGLVKLDLSTRTVQECHPGKFLGEAVFVKDPSSWEEDGGVLLSLAFDPLRMQSQLVVLDARNITAPPLCIVPLPGGHIPFSFHCGWVDNMS